MAKNTDNKSTTAFALQLVGSLFFLAVAAALWGVASSPTYWSGGVASGAFWATVFYAVAVLSAVSLFFTSIAQLGSGSGAVSWKAMRATTVAGFALAVLSASNQTLFAATVVGFVIATVGGALALKNWRAHK